MKPWEPFSVRQGKVGGELDWKEKGSIPSYTFPTLPRASMGRLIELECNLTRILTDSFNLGKLSSKYLRRVLEKWVLLAFERAYL